MEEFCQANFEKFGLKINSKRELISIINEFNRKNGKTPQEKFEILDLRDKILKLVRFEIEGNLPSQLKGTCNDMCPEKERYRREYLDLCHKYELRNGEVDHHLLVKEFNRSSADQDLPLPNEMRPPEILMHTFHYILNQIVPQINSSSFTDYNIADWYDFIWNRTRSMRKDIVQQRLNDPLSIRIHEICARWHIYCAHRLVEEPPNVFDFKINEENLKNCLQSLIEFYSDVNSPNEAEFRAYMILINLHDDNVLRKVQRFKPEVRKSLEVKHALNLFFAYNSKNYIKFFRLVNSPNFSYLSSCIAHRFFAQMRIEAFKVISSAYRQDKEKCYPLNKVVDLLYFDNESDLLFYCEQLNLDIIEDGDDKQVSFPNLRNINIEKPIIDRLRKRRSQRLVEEKFNSPHVSINEVIYGGKIDLNFNRLLVPSSSFDSNGYYCSDDLNEVLQQITQKSSLKNQPPKPLPSSLDSIFETKKEIKNQPATFLSKLEAPLFNTTTSSTIFQQVSLVKSDQNIFSTLISTQKPSETPKNLFSSLAKTVSKIEPSKIEPQPNKELEEFMLKMENTIFESLVNDILKSDVNWYILTLNKISYELFNDLQNDILFRLVDDQVKNISFDVIDKIRQETSLAYQRERQMLMLNATESITNDILEDILGKILKHEITNVQDNQRFVEKYSIDIYNDLYLDILANELSQILNDNLVEIAQNFYMDEVYPIHLEEILRETIEEETKMTLKVVDNRLEEDLNTSIDLFWQKMIFKRWKNKMSNRNNVCSSKNTTFYDLKNIMFSHLSNESYLLHVSWLNFNYKYMINNLKIDENVNNHLKMLFIMPKLQKDVSNDYEFIKRWLLSKFFHFDRHNLVYNTQIVYHLVTSFNKNNAIRFSIKCCPLNISEAELEAKIQKRTYYGANSIIFVLLPIESNSSFDEYINELTINFRRVLKSLCSSNIKFFFISYLIDEQQTKMVIDKLINYESNKQNISYIMLDGQIIYDNQQIENKCVAFINNCFEFVDNLPEICTNLSKTSLMDVFFVSLQVFLNYLIENRIQISIMEFIQEYNERVDILLEFLTKDEYRKLIWPLPEHTDFTNANMLRYWNSSEIFDDCLPNFANLLKLNPKTFEKITKNFDYESLKKILNDVLRNIESQMNSNSSSRSVYTKICLILDRLEITKELIEWQSIMSMIVNFILQNGSILFKNSNIFFDKFYVYCNLKELKSFDWVNYNNLIDKYPRFEPIMVLAEIQAPKNVAQSPLPTENRSKKSKLHHKTDEKFDSEFKKFMSLFNAEKNESRIFDSRLNETASVEQRNEPSRIEESLKRKHRHQDLDENVDVDKLLRSLEEERSRQLKLNKRINDTLNNFF